MAVSTSLGGWVNKVGVFHATPRRKFRTGPAAAAALAARPGRSAHRARHLGDEPLYAARSARAVARVSASTCCRSGPSTTRSSAAGSTPSFTLSTRAPLLIVATPSGITLSPGGRRPSVDRYTGARHRAAGAALLRALLCARSGVDAARGAAPVLRSRGRHVVYLRLSTQADRSDAAGAGPGASGRGDASGRRAGRRLSTGRLPEDKATSARRWCRSRPPGPSFPRQSGRRRLADEGIAANVLNLTSPGRLFEELRRAAMASPCGPTRWGRRGAPRTTDPAR